MQPDFDRSAAAMVAGTQKAIAAAVAPLLKRIEDLEARQPLQGPPGERGNDGVGVADFDLSDGVLVIRLSDGTEKQVGSVMGPPGQKGEDGVSPDPEAIIEAVAEEFRETAETIALGVISAAVAELPKPEKGEKGDRGEPGEPGEPGADGRGWAKSFIDRDGCLVATFSDGSIENLGPCVGKDGAPGRDGLGWEDHDEWFEDDGRILVKRYMRGDDFKEFRHQTKNMVYRGVFKEGQTYQPGDTVTWAGHLYHCNGETGEKPGDGFPWQQAIKRGRDGKDAKGA